MLLFLAAEGFGTHEIHPPNKIDTCLNQLQKYKEENYTFRPYIVTGDTTWYIAIVYDSNEWNKCHRYFSLPVQGIIPSFEIFLDLTNIRYFLISVLLFIIKITVSELVLKSNFSKMWPNFDSI